MRGARESGFDQSAPFGPCIIWCDYLNSTLHAFGWPLTKKDLVLHQAWIVKIKIGTLARINSRPPPMETEDPIENRLPKLIWKASSDKSITRFLDSIFELTIIKPFLAKIVTNHYYLRNVMNKFKKTAWNNDNNIPFIQIRKW